MILLLLACTAENPRQKPEIRRFHTSLEDLEEAVKIGFASGLPSMFQVGEGYVEILSEWGDENCPRFTDQYVMSMGIGWMIVSLQLAIDFSVLRPSQNYPFNKRFIR